MNPSYQVHQIKWSRKAASQLSEHVQRARKWLDDNPDWHPEFVHTAPKHYAEKIGEGSTSPAAYPWPDPKESQAQRSKLEPLKRKEVLAQALHPLSPVR